MIHGNYRSQYVPLSRNGSKPLMILLSHCMLTTHCVLMSYCILTTLCTDKAVAFDELVSNPHRTWKLDYF